MNTAKYGKNELIFANNALESCMYDIKSGSVGIYSNYSEKDEKLLVVLKAGDTFGELGMIEKMPRSATAVALEKTEVAVIEDEDFEEYFKDKPEKVWKILGNTSHRVRELTKDYLEVCAAVSDYADCQEKDEAPSDELMKKIKTFAGKRK